MLYLTGIAQEGAVLVLMPGNRTHKEVLFIREPNPRREHWNGHSLTKEEAAAESGIKKVYYAGELESFVTAMFNRRPHGVRRGEVTDAAVRHLLRCRRRESRDAGASPRSPSGAVGAADAGL